MSPSSPIDLCTYHVASMVFHAFTSQKTRVQCHSVVHWITAWCPYGNLWYFWLPQQTLKKLDNTINILAWTSEHLLGQWFMVNGTLARIMNAWKRLYSLTIYCNFLQSFCQVPGEFSHKTAWDSMPCKKCISNIIFLPMVDSRIYRCLLTSMPTL